jgi:lysophospholipase L1-like esterase
VAHTQGHELDDFYAALRSLEQHTRQSHVRVAWLGDSHGAADLWSGPLRAALQARFGDAGPGFVHVGYKSYRHENIRLEIKGRWAVHPKGPSTAVRTGDGVFGLGGVLLAGSADEPHATLTVADAALPSTLQWDLCYKLGGAQDEIQIGVTGQPDRVIKASSEPMGTLRHVAFTSTGASPALRVVPLGGQPALCGVTIETDPRTQPGVVLDTLGINGARLITPLAWNEEAWVAELARRPPSLVILEYGTNESGDHTIHPEAFVENLKRLLARVRVASPASDCLVLAPTDRADTEDRTPLVRDALRDAAKASACGFWDTYAVMGGKGSISAWRSETPPRAAPDGVHLNARGYKELGDRLAAEVLAGYRR